MSGSRQNAILESAGAVVAAFLKRRGFVLAAPVNARFHTSEHGSSGVDVTIALQDPSEAPAARAAIHEYFRCGGGIDAVTIR